MGVTGLWQILQPCARPIKIETLNRKRLAVDASIWIYQFLKAVRDKEGNALRNSHVVGFFRRICKLLFFGIQPVFVFDGGAPALKRQTVMGRRRRREGRREDAARTAGRLLAVEMQRRAEEEEKKRKEKQSGRRAGPDEEELDGENLVYVDEMLMSPQERQRNRKFRKKDQYHLPELDVSLQEMGGPNDPRIMSLEELEAYARQFDTGEDINVYDFSKIDYDSPFFMSLPASDRYNILNAARLRSRLRMGHSKEQLDDMFPDRMAFSRFQIERVTERNELTQRLMNINDPGGDMEFGINGTGRVAGEKGREYVLVKNDGVEGGWALGVVTNEGRQDRPIDIDKPVPPAKSEVDSEEDDGFEDVPIEGLNRLPKRQKMTDRIADSETSKQRQAFYKSRRQGRGARKLKRAKAQVEDPNSLFVSDAVATGEDDRDGWEDSNNDSDPSGSEEVLGEEDEDLRRAIAMSLEQDHGSSSRSSEEDSAKDELDNSTIGLFQQSVVAEAQPVPSGSARAIASVLNKRANNSAPKSRQSHSFGIAVEMPEEGGDDDEGMDLQVALVESTKEKIDAKSPMQPQPASLQLDPVRDVAKNAGFSGPLPFERLDLGSSLLGKKKMQQRAEESAGGFENPELAGKQQKKDVPLPPWFSGRDGELEEGLRKQKALEIEERERTREFHRNFRFQSPHKPTLQTQGTGEVIDLDADEEPTNRVKDGEIIDLEAYEKGNPTSSGIATSELADIGVEPPVVISTEHQVLSRQRQDQSGEFANVDSGPATAFSPEVPDPLSKQTESTLGLDTTNEEQAYKDDDDEELADWSESEDEKVDSGRTRMSKDPTREVENQSSRSPSLEFEDVLEENEALPKRHIQSVASGSLPVYLMDSAVPDQTSATRPLQAGSEDISGYKSQDLGPASGEPQEMNMPEGVLSAEFEDFSDPEEEEMLKALTLEAEEHARFASSLNPAKTQEQNMRDYESELKQLRNQQMKDRRDADEVTHIMIQECQQLLQLFGLPYVTAPMEAEAQCAELVRLGLVDGIVTDDSDCFLFGGTRVYKNMFNQAKFVECYLNSDLEKEFALTRQKLIQVAQLLGSDYTEGLPGVGPVTALEVISEFTSLEDFKIWLEGVQMQTITKEADKDNPFRRKFRKSAMKLILPTTFPDVRVDQAYLEPDVDSDPQAFQWGVPDLSALRSFLMATIGWSQERTDEVLVPVIRDMNRRMDEGTQSNITAFFDGSIGVGAAGKGGDAFAPRKRVAGSKRMGSALGRMAERARRNRNADTVGEQIDGVRTESADANPVTDEESQTTGKRQRPPKRPAHRPLADEDESEGEYEGPIGKKLRKKRATVSSGRRQQTAAVNTGEA